MVELAISVLKHVGVATALDTIVHVDCVQYVEVNPATHADTEVEVLVGKSVVPADDQCRIVAADILLVGVRFLVGRDDFAIFVVNLEVTVLVESGMLPDVVLANLGAFFQTV